MNTEQAKKLNLPAILAKLGHQPVKTTKEGQELWYHSPFRNDKTPSFHTSYLNGKWIWNDFGGTGGTVIDFALQHLATNNVSQALDFLAELTGRVGEGRNDSLTVPQPPSPPSGVLGAPPLGAWGPSLQLISTTPISNLLILNYLTQTRRIPEPLIRRYLTEVTYRNSSTNKQFFAFGLQNRAGGYEIRSASDDHPFKSVIGSRDITLIPGSRPTSGLVSIFEGTLDFLSLLAIMHLNQLEGDAIVMHSLSSYKKTIAAIRSANYQTINLFLDNDQSGVDVAFRLNQDLSNVANRSQLYHPYNDLNAFWVAAPKTTSPSTSKPAEQIYAATEDACRAVFQAHPTAKAAAYKAATQHPASGYQPRRSIADNMANEEFRSVFKAIVRSQYPDFFKDVEGLE